MARKTDIVFYLFISPGYKVKFEKLPRPIRQLAFASIGYRNHFARYGAEFRRFSTFITDSRYWGIEKQTEWQLAELRRLLSTAITGTRYYGAYSDILEDSLTKDNLREALETIPVLEKSSLRSSPADFINHNVKKFTESSTSGSTGSPMRVEHDRVSVQRRFAFLADHQRLAGVSFNEPSVRFSGRILCEPNKEHKEPWLYNVAERQLFLSSYHINKAHSEVIGNRLETFKPVLLDGYPSAVLACLKAIEPTGRQLSSLKAVITTAETLTDDVRESIERLSGAPVLDYYAASEGVPLIQQCPHGTYHVRWQSGIFEVLRDGEVSNNGDGELVCTSFVQNRTPLIRYRTGDIVKGLKRTGEVECLCGLNTPTVERVEGRVEDMVYTRDGRVLGMFTYRTLKFIDGLIESQVIQKDYECFILRCVPEPGATFSNIANAVKTSFEHVLGYEIELDIEVVERLPKGANGKVRLVQSLIPGQGTKEGER